MTRIDIHPPKLLCDQHLISNHREIKRICNKLEMRLKKNRFQDIPVKFYEPEFDRFKELFWLDKGLWTYNRYKELHAECLERGFKVTDYSGNWDVYQKKRDYFNNFKPAKYHYDLLETRIHTRLKGMKVIRYKGKVISYKDYCNNIWISTK